MYAGVRDNVVLYSSSSGVLHVTMSSPILLAQGKNIFALPRIVNNIVDNKLFFVFVRDLILGVENISDSNTVHSFRTILPILSTRTKWIPTTGASNAIPLNPVPSAAKTAAPSNDEMSIAVPADSSAVLLEEAMVRRLRHVMGSASQ